MGIRESPEFGIELLAALEEIPFYQQFFIVCRLSEIETEPFAAEGIVDIICDLLGILDIKRQFIGYAPWKNSSLYGVDDEFTSLDDVPKRESRQRRQPSQL